ncbi:hypothetical protein F4X10_12995 [Candidatus Poribacteria bacterium]|nr:hypothetical protein [Candidatus Poribacteria bacterium]
MNRTYVRPKLVALALILWFAVVGIETAAEQFSGLSGKVVDLAGNAVAGFTFAVRPVQLHAGFLEPEHGFRADLPKGETDAAGAFTINDIQPGLVQLIALPAPLLDAFEMLDPERFPAEGAIPPELMSRGGLKPDQQILSIQVGTVTFFNIGDHHFSEGLTFALEPGVIIEDVAVTVKPRLRIRGRVVYADGTPLANAEADLGIEQNHETRPNHSSGLSTNFFTDAGGYFTEYVEEPGFYTLSVEYNDLSAGAGPFLLKDGVQPGEIVLTLEGKPEPVEPPADDLPVPGNIKFRQPPAPPLAKSVWIINPTNGHAYKKVLCEDWQDAQRKAVEEGAHLVSINDEVEQHWLEVIFTHKPFWIGLTDVEKEGEWRWDSGEPVTYTNWATHPSFPDRLSDAEKDYVVVTFRQGGWQSAGPESPLWRMARWAVIEKDGLVSTIGE